MVSGALYPNRHLNMWISVVTAPSGMQRSGQTALSSQADLNAVSPKRILMKSTVGKILLTSSAAGI